MDDPGGPTIITRIFIGGRQERSDDGTVGWSVTRPQTQGMQESSISWERRKRVLSSPPGGMPPARGDWLWTPDHNCKRIRLCCLQPPVWQLPQQRWLTNTLVQFREGKYGHSEGQSPAVIIKINLLGHDWHFIKIKHLFRTCKVGAKTRL